MLSLVLHFMFDVGSKRRSVFSALQRRRLSCASGGLTLTQLTYGKHPERPRKTKQNQAK